jgi:hypothetical protein
MGRGGQEGPGKRREPGGRANPVPKPQLPSSDTDPGKPSREHNAPNRRGQHAAGRPTSSPTSRTPRTHNPPPVDAHPIGLSCRRAVAPP